MLDLNHVGAAVLYTVLGFVLLVLGFVIIDRMTPYRLWSEVIEKQNVALAVLLGFFSLSLAIIVAAAVVG